MNDRVTPVANKAADTLAEFGALEHRTYEDVLDKWQAARQQAQAWAAIERELRVALFGSAVPTPKEGVNNVELSDGRICKFTHKINRKLTDPVAARQAIQDAGVNDVEALVRTKYELVEGAYKKLEGPLRAVLDEYVESKPGLPTLEVK